MKRSAPPAPLYLLMAGLLFQGLSGLGGGAALLLDPSGALLQMPLDLLASSPFRTYLVPGLILFTVLGMGPLVVMMALWQQRAWAWMGALGISLALIIWIGVEIGMVGYQADPPLQLIYGSLGVGLLILTLWPSVRRSLA